VAQKQGLGIQLQVVGNSWRQVWSKLLGKKED